MLTAVFVRTAGKGRHGDGRNLYLLVKPDGRKSWVFRYRDRLTGKSKDMGLGSLGDVTLAEARQLAANLRSELLGGKDPIASRRASRRVARLEQAKSVTFGECTVQYVAAMQSGWRNPKHRAQWISTLTTYCAPINALPVSELDVNLIRQVLEPIWLTKTETADRVRSRIERVLDWATTSGYRSGENPAIWRGNLKNLLPSPSAVKKVQHRASLPYTEVPCFMSELKPRQDFSSLCLQLQILTATRPSEAAEARWAEFDLRRKSWTIPKERTKNGKVHSIPLSEQVVALLLELKTGRDGFLFPGRGGRAITTAAPLKLLKKLRPGMTCHGFRSSFRDWAAEQTAHSREAAEIALAHTVKSKTEAAYFRSDMFDKRIPLMGDWADYCSK